MTSEQFDSGYEMLGFTKENDGAVSYSESTRKPERKNFDNTRWKPLL